MMRLIVYGLLALYINVSDAFQDTSPFAFFSTSEILISSPQIIPATSLSDKIVAELKKCPSDTYVVLSQPGVNAADYQSRLHVPYLKHMMSGEVKEIRSSISVTDVIGNLDPEKFSEVLQDTCGARLLRVDASTGTFPIIKDRTPLVINLEFPVLPLQKDRESKLAEHDYLTSILTSTLNLQPSSKYTIIYTTTPTSAEHYSKPAESENYHIDTTFQSPIHMELKRDFASHKRASNSDPPIYNPPLFEKYQFFSPGILMGILVSIILLYILYIAISGIASLQVSYAAFNKDMGPGTLK